MAEPPGTASWKTDARALVVRTGVASHRGNVRDHNEDVAIVDAAVFGVADGVGGHAAGEIAAALAAEHVIGAARRGGGGPVAVAAAQAAVAAASASPELHGMGTTLCFGLAGWADGAPAVQVVNLGDSRGYLVGPDRIARLTRDHSWVQEMIDAGLLTEDQAFRHPRRNLVTRSVGAAGSEPDVTVVGARAGMRLLFCTDGVTDELNDRDLAAVVSTWSHPQAVADAVVDAVLAGPGRDNVTAVVVEVLAVRRVPV